MAFVFNTFFSTITKQNTIKKMVRVCNYTAINYSKDFIPKHPVEKKVQWIFFKILEETI